MTASKLSATSAVTLNSGESLPQFGFGLYLSKKPYESTLTAITEAGYRHIDGARLYNSEAEIGKAIKDSGVKREDIFLTTKLQVPDERPMIDQVREAVDLFDLPGGYVDLFLIHDPSIGKEKRLELWKAMIQLKKEGKTKAIGVSNYNIHHIEELKEISNIVPAVNQIELNPWCQWRKIVDHSRKQGIVVQAYCPLANGKHWEDKTLVRIAKEHDRDPAQILLRWSLQKDYVCLTKSDTPSRIVSNSKIFDFELSKKDMEDLDALDGPNAWLCWNVIEAP